MQPLVEENLHGVIYKAVAGHARLAVECRTGNANAKVGAKALGICTCMSGMGSAFVQYFQPCWLKLRLQLFLDFYKPDWQCRVALGGEGHVVVSGLMCLFRKNACTRIKSSIKPMLPNNLKLTQVLVEKL